MNNKFFSETLKKPWLEEFKETNFTESLLRNRMLNELFEEAIPVIPVHDSFIVPESKAHQLRQAMHEQYEINTGMEASIA